MYCKNCGREISGSANNCPNCGASLITGVNPDEPANGGLIAVSVLFPIVGIILGIIDINKGKKCSGGVYLKAAIITTVVCAVLMGIGQSMLLSSFM